MSYRNQGYLGAAVTIAVVAAIGLSACGRKGPLEPPPGIAATAANPDPIAAASAPQTPPPPDKPNRPFILDPLLD